MREIRLSGSEGGGAKSIVTPYPYHKAWGEAQRNPRTRNKKKNIEPAKRPKAVEIQTSIMIRQSAASRASVILNRRFLGFRCASPQDQEQKKTLSPRSGRKRLRLQEHIDSAVGRSAGFK